MKIAIFILFVFYINLFFAQNYTNLIEKEKYGKVWKKCQKKLKKDPNSIEDLYFSAVVCSRVSASNLFNPEDALNYYSKAIKEYNIVSDAKRFERLDKIPINLTSFRVLTDSISKGGLINSKKSNTEEAFIYFLNTYSIASEQDKKKAISERNRLAFITAQSGNSVEAFQKFIDKYPDAIEVPNAIVERDKLAFNIALEENTIDAFNLFINSYPNAIQKSQAWSKIYELAYSEAKKINTIESYESFLSNYPNAPYVEEATEKIHELAFNEAKLSKSSEKVGEFIAKYPKSSQLSEAKNLYEDFLFDELTNNENWISYKAFIQDYPENRNIEKAKSKIFEMSFEKEDAQLLDYILANYDYNDTIVQKHYELFTKDGELSTLMKYQENYPDFYIQEYFDDYNNADIANKLLLHLPYDKKKYSTYINYLSNVKDKELAFVVVQRILSPYISSKQYAMAIKELDKLPIDFKNEKIINLRSLLSSKVDNSIKLHACTDINTLGNEFSPIITADDKTLFFCGQNRQDNIGGEDIFESNISNSNFSTPFLNDLSSSSGNEAPVSISSDATKMFLFQSGKLFYSEKNYSGWSELIEIDEEINSGEWQGDAMLSSDGNYLFFSANREGEIFNINKMSDKVYHGDILYPTDLFLSKRDSEGNWSYPENLGDVINTRYCERFPFLHPDMKTLYFSSDGHGGLGKLDVFMTTRLSDSCWTCWSKPINLGKEINTIESDAGYKITTSGQEAYFALNNRKLQESSVLFILDVSGSMSGDKIEELKEVSKKTIEDVINNNAEVSITAFDGDCNAPITYYLPFTKDYNEVQLFIDNLYSSGGTPMYEAYYQASHLLKNTASKTSKNKILVLMTDGDATSCFNLNDVLYKLKSEKTLFRTQTIAYGVSENSTAYYDLNEISTYSGGDFYHAASTEDLGAAFEQANSNIYQIVSGPDNKDIYKINLPAHLRPDIVAKIEGELKNSKNQPVSTTIRWEDLESNTVIGTAKSDPIDGSYFIVLPMGKNYGYFIEDTTFFPVSQNLDLRNVSNVVEIKKDIKAISFKEMIEDKIAIPMNNLFFNPMKSDLLPKSIPELKRISKIIKDKNISVELSGHTDNQGSESMNLKLSEDRANSVKNFLISQGVSPLRIKAIGYGYSKPIASNDTDEGKALNRRVEILFID